MSVPTSCHCPASGAEAAQAHESDIAARAIADTRCWLERAVIGLNLCPFAKAPHVKGQIHYAVCLGDQPADLLAALRDELKALAAAPAAERETTLLIAPNITQDFLAFNDMLDRADALVEALDLAGVLQVAPFHPHFQFADTQEGDITNATNQSPWPTLHLIREDSIDRAVQAFPEAETIYEANIATMQKLGHQGWAKLDTGPGCASRQAAPPAADKPAADKP